MATVGGDFLTKLCEEFLSCDICQEDFDAHTHSPRILPCFHSFCARCLSQLSQGRRLKCPKCRAETAVEERIPADTTRLALLDFKQAISKEGPGCEGCREGGRATARCQECEEYLCDSCCQAHSKVKLTRNHSLVSLSEAKQAHAKLVQVSFKCERHADKKLELFCSTCEKVVCVICSQTMHRNCKEVVELESILNDKKEELESLCKTLENTEGEYGTKTKESEACLKKMEMNLKEGEDQVERAFAQAFLVLEARKAEVLQMMREEASTDRQKLVGQAATFRSQKAAAQTAAQYGRRVLALDLTPQLLEQKTDIEKTAKELDKNKTARIKSVPAYSFKIASSELATFNESVRNLGDFYCSRGDDSDTRLSSRQRNMIHF